MRVLFWTDQFWPLIGGVEVLATRFVSDMQQRGHELAVVTNHVGLNLSDNYHGIPIYRFAFTEALVSQDVNLILEIRMKVGQLKKTFSPDLIHIASILPSVFFHLHTARYDQCPLLVTEQTLSQRAQHNAQTILKQILTTAQWIVGCSRCVLSELQQYMPEITSRSSVIYNGSDPPDLEPAPLPADPARLLCLGRLAPEKGFDVALRAMPMILDRHPQTQLLIAGEGPLRDELEQLTRNLALNRSVQFSGWVTPEKVPELMNKSTMVLVPSRIESFGLVALEAAFMARPVVATVVGGLPEVVEHEKTGVLVEPEDADQLAHAAVDLLDNEKRMAQMGSDGRKLGIERFRWTRYLDAYETLYEKLTAKWPVTESVSP